MIAPRDGTSVAISDGVRPFFLAWLTIALLLFALGRLSHAGDELMPVHAGPHVRVTVDTARVER